MGLKWKGPVSELPDRLQVVIKEQSEGGFLKQAALVDVYVDVLLESLTEVYEALNDGFDLSDLSALGSALAAITEIAVNAKDMAADIVDEFVGDCALVLYKIWDPGIPYLWESAEDKLESAALHTAASFAVGLVRSMVKKREEKVAQDYPRTDYDTAPDAPGEPESGPVDG